MKKQWFKETQTLLLLLISLSAHLQSAFSFSCNRLHKYQVITVDGMTFLQAVMQEVTTDAKICLFVARSDVLLLIGDGNLTQVKTVRSKWAVWLKWTEEKMVVSTLPPWLRRQRRVPCITETQTSSSCSAKTPQLRALSNKQTAEPVNFHYKQHLKCSASFMFSLYSIMNKNFFQLFFLFLRYIYQYSHLRRFNDTSVSDPQFHSECQGEEEIML